jgi:hypothetical protein
MTSDRASWCCRSSKLKESNDGRRVGHVEQPCRVTIAAPPLNSCIAHPLVFVTARVFRGSNARWKSRIRSLGEEEQVSGSEKRGKFELRRSKRWWLRAAEMARKQEAPTEPTEPNSSSFLPPPPHNPGDTPSCHATMKETSLVTMYPTPI